MARERDRRRVAVAVIHGSIRGRLGEGREVGKGERAGRGGRRGETGGGLLVWSEPHDAAVVLVAAAVVLHAGVDDRADGPVNVVRTHVLEEVHHLTADRLQESDIRRHASGVRHQASGVTRQASVVWHQSASVKRQASGVRRQASDVQYEDE